MANKSPYYRFNFNKVYVIESLPQDEERSGEEMYNSAIRPRAWQLDALKSEYIYVSTPEELFSILKSVEEAVFSSLFLPYMHFEVHGSRSGIHLQQGVVTWQELTAHLRPINVATRNNLMLSFATCFANEIHKCIEFSERAPFFGFVAPIASVSLETVKSGFDIFFNQLFTGVEFKEAYNSLNRECIEDEYFVLENCENAFTTTLTKQITELQNPVHYAAYVLKIANEMLSYKSIRQVFSLVGLIEQSKRTADEVLFSLVKELDYFLMKDIPPHTMIAVNNK